MGQAIYEDIAKQQAAAGAGPSANGSTGSPAGAAGRDADSAAAKDDVVDAEYTVEKE